MLLAMLTPFSCRSWLTWRSRKSYAKVVGRSRYQEESDIGAGTREEPGPAAEVGPAGVGGGAGTLYSEVQGSPGPTYRPD